MIPEGTEAPGFELPGWVDGERRRVALDEFRGEDIVILAFYPADFNPACEDESDLDELDLFTMQKDVTVLGIGPDTLYSHEAFADAYDLHVPLLADTRREVAAEYGLEYEDGLGQSLIQRAVVVVDHDGEVAYTWNTRDPRALPPTEEIKEAIGNTGGDDTAFARYRVGHAHYTEGRRAFTSAMNSYQDSEWMMAQSDFKRAREEFEEAAEHFESAVRFVDDDELESYYDHTQEKATALWQAADWLGKSANAYSSGSGAEGKDLRNDAERPLENARDIGEPIPPDEWPPEFDDEGDTILPQQGGDENTALTVDIDEEVAAEEAAERDTDHSEDQPASGDGEGDEDAIDDEELEAIEAELAASQPENPVGEELEETPTSMVDAPPEDAEENGDIDGDVGEDDLAALEEELAANQPDDPGVVDDADGAETEADDDASVDDADDADFDSHDGSGGGFGDDGPADEFEAGDDAASLAGDGDPPADPHADLASGSGGAVGGSLEPDDGDEDDEPELDEPQGASDDDLADIPTAEDLADDEDDERSGDGGGY